MFVDLLLPLQLSVELGSRKKRQRAQVEPEHEDDDTRERPIRLAVGAAEIRHVERESQGRGQPDQRGDAPAR